MALTDCTECGHQVSDAATACPNCGHPIRVPDEARIERLNDAIANRLARYGTWRVESRTDFEAIIVGGKPVKHLLHLLLTVLTVGMWLIVWIILLAGGGESRYRMAIDPYGNGTFTRI